MSSLSKWILPALLFPAAVAFAGNKVGNGGDGVWCKGAKPEVRLLDFYEAGLPVDNATGSVESVTASKLEKLRAAAPKLAAQYLKRLAALAREIEVKKDARLTDVPDSKHAFEPLSGDCRVVQLAIRKRTITAGEKRFLIREDLWSKMSATDRAGLYVHEIVYEHLSKLGETDSIKARKLTAYLFHPAFDGKTFWKHVRELELPIYP